MAYELDLTQLIEQNLPAGFTVGEDFKNVALKTWQLLLYQAAEIPEDKKYDIEEWNDEWRIVLAYCVVYDVYMYILSGRVIFAGGSTSTEESTGGSKTVKKITTGPTEVEYYNDANNLALIIKDWSKPGGLLYLFFNKACMASRVVGVKLPFCEEVKKYTAFLIAKPGKEKVKPCKRC